MYLIILFFGLLVITLIGLRIFYPPGKLKAIAMEAVGNAIGGEVALGEAKFNLFRGIDLNDVAWQPAKDLDTTATISLQLGEVKAKRIMLKHRLTSLLRRHAHVKSILFESPEIELRLVKDTPDEPPTQPKDSEDETKKPDVVTQEAEMDSSRLLLPVRITLDELDIKNAVLHIIVDNGKTAQDIFLGNLSFKMHNLKVPREDLLTSKNVRANIEIICDDATFRFDMQPSEKDSGSTLGVHGRLNLDLQTDIIGLDSLSVNGSLKLDQLELFGFGPSTKNNKPSYAKINNPVSLDVNLFADAVAGNAVLKTLAMGIGQAVKIALEGNAEQLFTEPIIKVSITNGNIFLADALPLGQKFMPPELNSLVKFTNPDAAFSLRNTHALGQFTKNGNIKNAFFEMNIAVDNISADFLNRNGRIFDFSVLAQVSGQLDSTGFEQLDVDMSTFLGNAEYSLNDTTEVWCGALELSAKASLNSQFLPVAASCSLKVQNILGATLTGEVYAASAGTIADTHGSGHFVISDLLLSDLPNVPVESHANLDLSIDMASIDSVAINAALTTDSLRIPMDEILQSFPGLELIAAINARTDPAFQSFQLDSLTASLNEFIMLRGSGSAQLGDTVAFTADVHELRIDHDNLLDWVPSGQREQLADLNLSGYTGLSAHLEGEAFADSLLYALHTEIKTHDTRLDYPSKFITISGANVNLTADVTQKNGVVNLDVVLDTVRTDNLPESVFTNNTIQLKASTPDFLNFELTEGTLELPDLRAKAEFYAQAKNLSVNPTYQAELNFKQTIPDTLEITRSLGLHGEVKLHANISMDTSIATVTGQLITKGLDLFLPPGTRISGANCQLGFSQSYDLQNNRLLAAGNGLLKIPSATTVDYQLFRSYYNQTLDDFSYLYIDHIKAAGYTLDSLRMDLLLGNSRLEIPQFLINIYGGNLGGSMSFDLSSGDFQKAKYRLSAHLSSVNSALLLPGIAAGEEESLINANMQFEGKGLDTQTGIEIAGQFYITEIGPKVADNFLRSLDPKGTESGIRTTRLLINRGFKPKLFFFEAKHGYLYPTVTFKQPWYFPLKLSGGKVELPRMPIEFFLQNAVQQREKKGYIIAK